MIIDRKIMIHQSHEYSHSVKIICQNKKIVLYLHIENNNSI
jgi:hypothetical protein